MKNEKRKERTLPLDVSENCVAPLHQPRHSGVEERQLRRICDSTSPPLRLAQRTPPSSPRLASTGIYMASPNRVSFPCTQTEDATARESGSLNRGLPCQLCEGVRERIAREKRGARMESATERGTYRARLAAAARAPAEYPIFSRGQIYERLLYEHASASLLGSRCHSSCSIGSPIFLGTSWLRCLFPSESGPSFL